MCWSLGSGRPFRIQRDLLRAGADQAGRAVAERPEVYWDRVLFCIKESTYKAWFPLTHRWLGFEDASVDSR
jgi:4'-phosphopantetheinyl transferase EntD